MLASRLTGQDENAGSNDCSDAQHDQIDRTECLF
jgi:hypothetical protein